MSLNGFLLFVFLFFNSLFSYSQIGIGATDPATDAALEIRSNNKGFLPPRLTLEERDAITNPTTGLVIYNTTNNCLEWYDGFIWYNGCGANAGSGGTAVAEIISCGGSAEMAGDMEVGAPVVGVTQIITVLVRRIGTYNYWASANGITFLGMGYFGSTGEQKVILTASGTPLDDGSWEFRLSSSCTFARRVTIMSGFIVSATGRTWEDRNLGADHVASSARDYTAYGSLFQWGRGADGHEVVEWLGPGGVAKLTKTVATLSNGDQPPHDSFITTVNSGINDWRATRNDMLWQGVNGINNPCKSGYRLPTTAEFEAEKTVLGGNPNADQLFQALKLTSSGMRFGTNALIGSSDSIGYYWTSTVSGTLSINFTIGWPASALTRSSGHSVRCIKD